MLEKGRVVIPLAGKDAGRPHIVVEADEQGFALIADGRHRKLEAPKRKNPKHLRATGDILLPEDYSTDRRLRRTLNDLTER